MSAFVSVVTGVKSPKPVVPEVAVEFAYFAKFQARTSQTIQRVESSLIPTSGDTTMGEAPEVNASNPDSGLPSFLAHFDLLEFNSLPASHCH